MNRILILLFASVSFLNTNAQCESIAFADSSFEDGSFPVANPWQDPWVWSQNDGAELSNTVAYTGTYSVCSNSGGPIQLVEVDSNTNYFLSCFVKNGASDFFGVQLIIDGDVYPVTVASDNWTIVSVGFNSGSDTIISLGALSANACFDDFRLTCESLVKISALEATPFLVLPTITSESFTVELSGMTRIEVIDIKGNIIKRIESEHGSVSFGENFPSGVYFVMYNDNSGVYSQRIIKL